MVFCVYRSRNRSLPRGRRHEPQAGRWLPDWSRSSRWFGGTSTRPLAGQEPQPGWWASDVSAWKCRLQRSSQVTGESRPGVTNIYQQFFVILAVTLIQPNTAAGINRATAGLKGWNLFWDLSWYTTIGIIKNFGAFWLGNTKILKFEIFWGVSISFAGTVDD